MCQGEAPQHSSSWKLLLVCLLWLVLAGCMHGLKNRLRLGHTQDESLLETRQETVMESRNLQYSWAPPSRSSGPHVPLAHALAKSLLLCVLQEPLPDPSIPQVQALISKLESVSLTLETTGATSEAKVDRDNQDSVLMQNVRLICKYLQQRMKSLRALVQVQGHFAASVKDMLEGLDGLWAQLEELHTGVTLTKEGSRDQEDLTLAHKDAEKVSVVLVHYNRQLQCCQAHLKEVTQILQELTWSHTHISNSVSSSSESVWPELLLQSNIEQFDKVQESFLSLEQQTSTFQAHLEGLREENQERHSRPLTSAGRANSCSLSPPTSPQLCNGGTDDASRDHYRSASASTSVSSVDPDSDAEKDTRRFLCEKSGFRFSAFGRLRRSGKKK